MKDIADITLCLVDNGLFSELALRLARDAGRVRIYNPWEAEFPTINDRSLGKGLPGVDWVSDAYLPDVVDSTDVYVYPDIFHAGKQLLLERLGKAVWGSRTGDTLETDRFKFRRWQEEQGMPVPKWAQVVGLSNLRAVLKEKGHCFVKTRSTIRGSWETFEHFDYEQSESFLDEKAYKMGAAAESVDFMIEEPVETPFETGIDTYSIDGQSPKTPMQGIEIKGHAILCSAQTKSPTPKPLDEALTLLSGPLKSHRYRNFLSAEFRKDMLTDICCRCPNPGIGCEMEMISNLTEIIVRGAHGELVEPVFEAEFGMQVAIFHNGTEDSWKQFRIPPEIRRWVKFMEVAQFGQRIQIIPRPPHGTKIGWLVGIGDSIKEVYNHLHATAELLKDHPFDIKMEAAAEAIRQAQEAEESGNPFASEPIPDPAELEEKA